MDEHDQANDVNDAAGQPPNDEPAGERVPIPSRVRAAVDDLKARIADAQSDDRDVIAEYEARYYGTRSRLEDDTAEAEEVPPTSRGRGREFKIKRKPDYTPDDNERKWAALAHGSTLLTALSALTGVGVLVTLFIPLLIYFSFRKRSEYVAFHALQAFALQLVGTVGWLALVLVGSALAVALLIVSIILIIVAVGIVLVPLVALTWVVFLVASLLLPLGMVIYGVIASVETWAGHNYRIPYIARWVESQMPDITKSVH